MKALVYKGKSRMEWEDVPPPYFLPPAMQEFRDPIGLSIVVLVLLFRPNGLIPAASLKSVKV